MAAQSSPGTFSTTLLRRPTPRWNESLRGYLLRLDHENHSPHFRPFLGSIAKATRVLPAVESATGHRSGPLLIRAASTSSSYAGTKAVQMYGKQLPKQWCAGAFKKVCPECLAESGFMRLTWELMFFHACPIHRCALITHCQACCASLDWDRGSLFACRCGADLRQMTAVKVSQALVLVTGLLTELVHASVETRVALEEAGLISHLWRDDGQELVRLAILVQHVLPRTWWASAAQNELESQECIASLVLKVLNEGAQVLEAIVFAAVHDQFKEAPRHPRDGPWSEDYLRRALAERFHLPPLLLSSETVETWLLPLWHDQYRRWVTAQEMPITAAQRAEAAREQRKQVARHQRFWKQHDRMEAARAEKRAKEVARANKEAALEAQRQRQEEFDYAYMLELYRREPRHIWEMHYRVRERFFKRMLCT